MNPETNTVLLTVPLNTTVRLKRLQSESRS